jgi:uncharacterized membrane protein
MQQVGKWAFIAGLAVAALAGLGFEQDWVAVVLAVLGLVVGFMNVTGAETQKFLLAAVGLILSAMAVQDLPIIGDIVTRILLNLVVFIAPALLVVALKSLLETAKD